METGRYVYQVSDQPGHNMSFYYLFKNGSEVDGTSYLAYRNMHLDEEGAQRFSYYSVNLETGEQFELTPRGLVGSIAEVVAGGLYCLGKERQDDASFTSIRRYDLDDGTETVLVEFEAGPVRSHNVMVNCDGSLAFFYHASEKSRGAEVWLADLRQGTVRKLFENRGVSHIQFGPVHPNIYMYNSREFSKGYKMVGFGRVDTDPIRYGLLDTEDPFLRANLKKYEGDLIASHPYWDRAGNPMVDYVDTTRPYSPEYNIRFIIDQEQLGEIKDYDRVRLEMGGFQCHFNPGPTEQWFVGDGESADWWHKPGYGKPCVHKLHFDYETGKATLIPLAKNTGGYWKSGEFEPNARYIPAADLVVWSAFRTLDGAAPGVAPEGLERKERDWLLGPENAITQKVFATPFSDSPGWDFSFDSEGWKPVKDMTDFTRGDPPHDYPFIRGLVVGPDPLLLSPGELDIPAQDYPRLLIRLRNFTSAERLKLFYVTEENPNFSEDKRVTVRIYPRSESFETYLLDMAAQPNWQGHIQQLRLNPAVGSEGGKVDIQFLRFLER